MPKGERKSKSFYIDSNIALDYITARNRETILVLNKIKDKDLVVAVDLNGPERDSETFAKYLDGLFVRGNSEIVFVIGGSLGLSPEVQARADEVVTLSKLTFTHQMTRVILLEQIYRAIKINRNETYHK